jgi:predicted nucleic acid-binding protein
VTFLLDTCVISELARPRPDAKVVRWMDSIDERKLYLSVLTLGELEKGVTKLPDTPRKADLRAWLEHDLPDRFANRILPVDAAVAVAWGELLGRSERAGAKLPVIDALLAATARVHRLVLATRNVADFERGGASVFDPWG